jgi:hypothetical protein
MENSIDSIENYSSYKRNYQHSNDEISSKSREKFIYSNNDTKSFVLNANIIDEVDNKRESPPPQQIHASNSREMFKFDRSFTIHEDNEEVLNNFDDNLKEIENNFNSRLTFDEEKFDNQNSTEILDNEDDDDGEKNNVNEQVQNNNLSNSLSYQVCSISSLNNYFFLYNFVYFFFKSFEKDVVQQFCEKHINKIKAYVENLHNVLPMPVDCWIEEKGL